MRDVLPVLARWAAEAPDGALSLAGVTALAIVVRAGRPSLKPVGATMLVHSDGRVAGSLSAGCVEAAVIAAAQEAMGSGIAAHRHFGAEPRDPFDVATTCGGALEVLVTPLSRHDLDVLVAAAAAVAADRCTSVSVSVRHDDPARVGRWGRGRDTDTDRDRRCDADSDADNDADSDAAPGSSGDLAVIRLTPRPRLLVFGSVDIAAATAALGEFLGYRVTVCDPRPALLTPARFPAVSELVVDRPHRYLSDEVRHGRLGPDTAVVVLTHDLAMEISLLRVALSAPGVAYVGAMGSRELHARRIDLLAAAGVPADQLGRLSGPLGLDLGADTPQETALSILAEVMATRTGGSGRRLSQISGPVHGSLSTPRRHRLPGL